ncbi:MAG TPA: diiron oxygenase [Acidimicrobiales bacterium]|nr:diiron oxygenase [Acidimicrobiales bacterium]
MATTLEQARPAKSVGERIERLSTASLTRILEPETHVPGEVGPGQVLPDELLSVADVPHVFDSLTPEQKRILSREEFASIVDTGVRFESVLMAGFSMEIVGRSDLTDPRVTYLLHEMGEETRHSRLFVRLLAQIKPQAKNPLDTWVLRLAQNLLLPVLTSMPSLFCLLVLSGEEVPDLMQKLASEHPDTDPMIKAVSKYHRQEEARHLAFARMLFPEQWASAGWVERVVVRHLGSHIAIGMFDTIVHPGVYATVGLPTWKTWRAVNRSAGRTAMRHRALKPLLAPLLDAKVFRGGRIPKGWQRAAGVDRHGRELATPAAV